MRSIKSQLRTELAPHVKHDEKYRVGDKWMNSYKFNEFDKCSAIIKMSFLSFSRLHIYDSYSASEKLGAWGGFGTFKLISIYTCAVDYL